MAGKKRTFLVTATVSIELTVAASVLSKRQLKGAARDITHELGTEEGALNHIARNIVLNDCVLSSIDGFANLPDDRVKALWPNWDLESVDEVLPKKKGGS